MGARPKEKNLNLQNAEIFNRRAGKHRGEISLYASQCGFFGGGRVGAEDGNSICFFELRGSCSVQIQSPAGNGFEAEYVYESEWGRGTVLDAKRKYSD